MIHMNGFNSIAILGDIKIEFFLGTGNSFPPRTTNFIEELLNSTKRIFRDNQHSKALFKHIFELVLVELLHTMCEVNGRALHEIWIIACIAQNISIGITDMLFECILIDKNVANVSVVDFHFTS